MFEVIDKAQKPFPLERAVLVSLVAHVVIFVLLVSSPPPDRSIKPGGFLANLVEPAQKEPPIPIVFREAPGPARQNPRPSDLSDADRRAGGGDRSRPRSRIPFFQPQPGIEGLETGRRSAAADPQALEKRGSPASREGEAGAEDSAKRQATIFGPPAQGDAKSPVFPRAEARSGERERLASLDEAIRDAARGAAGGGGQEGAGFPSPEGGYVDSGPLSFDTTWYDWGPYAAEMVRRIKMHWEIPELARLGWKGKLTIRFFILADGQVADATIIRRSGVPPFDFAAMQAILKSSPFRPLPSDLGSSREGVTVTFFYNIRPEKEGRPDGTR